MLSNISQNDNISLDNVCSLVSVRYETDDIGQEIETTSEREVFCAELTVYNSESYRAAQQDIKSACVLAVDTEEYEGEEKVSYNSKLYGIYKIRKRSDGMTELYCEVRSDGG
jgi:SPP1 family predicted phage head-tail adaptor